MTLYFGIHVLVIVVDGNRDPSLPATTACPVLSGSMMPGEYSMQPSFGYHMRMFVRPSASLDIVVEHRCYNHNVGTSFLWVNNQLAAFSTLDISDVDKVTSMAVNGADGAIFDCHGKRLWRTSYERIKNNKEPKLRVYSDSGVHIYTSSIPEDTSEADGPQIVYSQPENVECARLSTDWKFTVSNPLSPACDPRLLAMLFAKGYFTKPTSAAEKLAGDVANSGRRRNTEANSDANEFAVRWDTCNGFVVGGGVVAITFLITGFCWCLMLCYFEVYVPWDRRRKGMTSVSAAQLAAASSKKSENELFVEMRGA